MTFVLVLLFKYGVSCLEQLLKHSGCSVFINIAPICVYSLLFAFCISESWPWQKACGCRMTCFLILPAVHQDYLRIHGLCGLQHLLCGASCLSRSSGALQTFFYFFVHEQLAPQCMVASHGKAALMQLGFSQLCNVLLPFAADGHHRNQAAAKSQHPHGHHFLLLHSFQLCGEPGD